MGAGKMTTETSTTTMQAFAFDEIGSAGSVRTVPTPALGEGEVPDLDNLAGMVSAGELTVPVARVFSLEEAPQAIDRLAAGGVQGKVVIDCSSR
jgi:NADPH:quinone reductase-like Zn-dependent oxidoreductase